MRTLAYISIVIYDRDMSLFAKQVTAALRTLIVAAGLLAVPTITNSQSVQAMSMEHHKMGVVMSHGSNNCCQQQMSTGIAPEQIKAENDEIALPDPDPVATVPYYVAFQETAFDQPIKPTGCYAQGLPRPPDILRQTTVLRF